jgi:hypothetical protein
MLIQLPIELSYFVIHPVRFNVNEDTLRYILHVPGTEALPTYRLGQERPEKFDRISENVFVESLAIKFVMKIMAPVRVRVLAYLISLMFNDFRFRVFLLFLGIYLGYNAMLIMGLQQGH